MVEVIRKHWASFIWPMTKTFVMLATPLFFAFFLLTYLWGVIILIIWLIVGLVYGFYQWFVWYFDSFVITDRRIINIDQQTLFRRKVSEADLENVQDSAYTIDGMLASMFDFGTVSVRTASEGTGMRLSGVPDPKRVQETIMDLTRKVNKNLSADDLIEYISKAKNEPAQKGDAKDNEEAE